MLISQVDTPALIVDLDLLESNISEMAGIAKEAGVRLRPHIKTHKSPEIAKMQLDNGATGITVAKLSEAKVMIDNGFTDILIAYPIVGESKLRLLKELAQKANLTLSLDSPEVAQGVSVVGQTLGKEIPVYLEVDTGLGRMGVPTGIRTSKVAWQISNLPGLKLQGLMTHAGHVHRAKTMQEKMQIARDESRLLVEQRDRLACEGLYIPDISIGSTPTARLGMFHKGVTEIRPGTYVFNDMMQVYSGLITIKQCAARVLVTVVAKPVKGRAIIDGGSKTFSQERNPDYPGFGCVVGRDDLILETLYEEHGVLRILDPNSELNIGDKLEIIPYHICVTVNNFHEMVGVRQGGVEKIIPVAAQGCLR